MIRIKSIKISCMASEADLWHMAEQKLGQKVLSMQIVKKSLDARQKNNICYIYTIDCMVKDETQVIFGQDVERSPVQNVYQVKKTTSSVPPVIVGSGPAGMLAALALAEAGLKPVVIEQGKDVSERRRDVDLFWKTGKLNPSSNVQFGEGGAGTFSDGKLMTGIKKDEYTAKVLQVFVQAGAPEDILYLAKPHIGTDNLVKMVENIRHKIEELGGQYMFETKMTGLVVKDEKIQALKIVQNGRQEELACRDVILAVGHSARDTFEMLYRQGVQMIAKPFSVGVRIEHHQSLINQAQYGKTAPKGLPAADYKLAVHLPNGRSAYTFCMCPGGEVVAAASEIGGVVTNGMSYYKRDKQNANAALLVGVEPSDFGDEHPLAGMYFQRRIEQKAFSLGGGSYQAPVQRVGDFLNKRPSVETSVVKPSYRPKVICCEIDSVLPDFVSETLRLAIVEMDKKLKGFSHPDAVLTAPETRSSSPVRILRGSDFQSNIKGLYPCGEGAGYAGGITSSAADGLKTAQALLEKY